MVDSCHPTLHPTIQFALSESGPAAGVLMCVEVGHQEGFDHVLTFNMGGTTAKLGAIDEGEPAVVPTFEVDQVRYRKGSGLPLNISAIELLEIGAGGGSIAVSEMGLIKVGPESAGADPGPICYRRGGKRPTVTDANLVLGYINPNYFNGGAMTLDLEAARAGVAEAIGRPLDLDVAEAAWGVYTMANSNMERAMRVVSVERGRDPRQYALVSFGGAGPLHASRLARALGVPKVVVPYGAGVGAALGMLRANSKLDQALTRILHWSPEARVRSLKSMLSSDSACDEILPDLIVAVIRNGTAMPTCATWGRATKFALTCRLTRTCRVISIRLQVSSRRPTSKSMDIMIVRRRSKALIGIWLRPYPLNYPWLLSGRNSSQSPMEHAARCARHISPNLAGSPIAR